MRVLKSICRKNKIFLFFYYFKPDGKSVGHLLLCLSYPFPFLSSCVINLFELNKSRYPDLQSAGGEYCLPVQMEINKDKHQLIIYEIDGDIFGDSSNTLSESLQSLGKLRLVMQEMVEDDGCPLIYVAELTQQDSAPIRSEYSVPGLPNWPRPVSYRMLTRESK